MKKLLTLAAILILFSSSAYSADVIIETKGDYHYFACSTCRDTWGPGIKYGLELSIISPQGLGLWVGGSYLSKDANPAFREIRGKLELIPIGGGVKLVQSAGTLNFYSGFGVNHYQYKETNPNEQIKLNSFGFIGKVGIFAKVIEGLMIDVYLNYSRCIVEPHGVKVNVGGYEAGLGLGYIF